MFKLDRKKILTVISLFNNISEYFLRVFTKGNNYFSLKYKKNKKSIYELNELRGLIKREKENNKYNFWYNISWFEKLSKISIRKFQDKVDWYWISWCQTLSESFIREFQDRVNWYCISECQTLSESFILEFKEKIIYSSLEHNENVTITEKIKQAFENE